MASALLSHRTTDVNGPGRHGMTPLMYAAQAGHDRMAVLLLRLRADRYRCNDQVWRRRFFLIATSTRSSCRLVLGLAFEYVPFEMQVAGRLVRTPTMGMVCGPSLVPDERIVRARSFLHAFPPRWPCSGRDCSGDRGRSRTHECRQRTQVSNVADVVCCCGCRCCCGCGCFTTRRTARLATTSEIERFNVALREPAVLAVLQCTGGIGQVRPREAVDLRRCCERRRSGGGRVAGTGGARGQPTPPEDLPRLASRAIHPADLGVLAGVLSVVL